MAEKGYLVLARKWRPQRFEDVVGQEHITRTLKNAITSGRIHHAFLFIGSRGIGKTTTARVLAKALNCLSADKPTPEPCGVCDNCVSIGTGTNIDVIEIDGASNNGVDDVREIRDNIRMVPSNGRYKVYIIDEVHQLSISAFNALLKTLEEPPPHAVFVLATTEAHKIPPTIISRCQRYDFRRVGIEGIMDLLRGILVKEGLEATEDALHAIARSAEGGVRDAESILDQLITYCNGPITYQDVFDVLGLVDWKVMHELSEAILHKDIAKQLGLVEDVVAGGKDLTQFVQDILRYYRNLLVCKASGSTELLQLPEDECREVKHRSESYSITHLIKLVEQFAALTSGFDSQLAQRIALETLLISVSKVGVDISLDTVLEKLLLLGDGSHAAVSPAASSPAPRPAPAGPPPRQEPPPENPPPAGAAEPAPPPPAAPVRRVELTPKNLAKVWPRLIEKMCGDNLQLHVALQAAIPSLAEDALVLGFGQENDAWRQMVEKADQRQALEAVLATYTENVTQLRVQTAAPAVPEKVETRQDAAPPTANGHYAGVNPEEAQEVLQNPALAHVAEVFRGRIVEIKRG